MARFVVIHGQLALHALGGEILPQPLFPHRVGDELGAQLRRRRAQHLSQLAVLPADRRPILPQTALVLPPVEQSCQLLVDGGEEVGKLHAAVGEISGEVAPLAPAPLQHGGQGVVEGVVGGHIIPLPAGGLERAALAHPVRRPVKDSGSVVIVGASGVEGTPHGFVQTLEGGGGVLHPALYIGHGSLLSAVFGLPGHQGAHLPQQLVRQQEKDYRGGKHLVEQRNV